MKHWRSRVCKCMVIHLFCSSYKGVAFYIFFRGRWNKIHNSLHIIVLFNNNTTCPTWRSLWAVWPGCLGISWHSSPLERPWRRPWVLHSPGKGGMIRWDTKQNKTTVPHICGRSPAPLPHLDADAALQLQLQPDHVHLLRVAQLVELGDFARHLIDGHLDGVHLGALLLHHLDALLQVREAGARCRETGAARVFSLPRF